MSREREKLRMLINQSLSLAAAEIFELFERTIAEYEEQLCPSKEEKHTQHWKQHMTQEEDSGNNKPEQHTQHNTDVQQLFPEEVPAEQQERRLNQEDPPGAAHTKEEEEEEEVWGGQEGEQLQGPREEGADGNSFVFTPVHVKREEDDGERFQFAQLHENQPEEKRETENSNSDNQPHPAACEETSVYNQSCDIHGEFTTTEEPVENVVFDSESASASGSQEHQEQNKDSQSEETSFSCTICEVQQLLVSEDNVHPQHQKKILDQEDPSEPPHVKEEEEDLWRSGGAGTSALIPTYKETSRSEYETGLNPQKELYYTGETSAHSSGQKEQEQGRQTGEKPFVCVVCCQRFTTEKGLMSHRVCHRRTHKRDCSVCKRTFNKKYELIRHMRTHTGERPFACSFCGRGFRQKAAMMAHQRIHTGEKPFSCSICGKLFSRRESMKRHMVLHF